MRRSVIAMLLVVAMLFSVHYAAADKSMDELDKEFDQLLEEYVKKQKELEQIETVKNRVNNGLKLYPDNGWEDEYAFQCDTVIPQMANEEEARQYIGNPYLLTGKVLAVKGYGFDFQLEDGRLGIVSLDRFDFDTGEFVVFGNGPYTEGRKINVYCTFLGMSKELIADDCLHFLISVSEKARQFALKKKEQ